MSNEPNKISLYAVNRNVKCLKCGYRGAVKGYGVWYPDGLGDEAKYVKSLQEYRNKEYMSYRVGFGGTIPYECLNCGNQGLVDFGGLEGYQKAFETIQSGEDNERFKKNI